MQLQLMKHKCTVAQIAACVSILLAAIPSLAQGRDADAFTRRAAAPAAAGVTRRVLAMYYPWYANTITSHQWLHYSGLNITQTQKAISSHTHYPKLGAYDSTDPATISKHLAQAQSAGIDTLVCSWWGRTDHTDKAIKLLLEQAPKYNITIAVYVERWSKDKNPVIVAEELSYIMEAFTKRQAYLRVGGKPVVFFYSRATQSLTPNDWASVLNRTDVRYPPGLITIGNGNTQADALLWQGVHSLDTIGSMKDQTADKSAQILHESFAPPVLLARALGKIAIETVAPGYDDRSQSTLNRTGSGTSVDRLDGKLYEATFAQAIKDNPDWIIINSFNQWHAGTEIEPSTEYGDKFLTLTKDLATRFKAQENTKR